MYTSRRKFLASSLTFAAGAGMLSAMPSGHYRNILGANEKVVAGVIGINGMGFADIKAFLGQPNTECAAICDVDENVLARQPMLENSGKNPASIKIS
jgi:hypothetical protein